MKILYYTTGMSGSGNLVLGVSVANSLRRAGVEHTFSILSSSPGYTDLVNRMQVRHGEIPFENEAQLSPDGFSSSALYRAIAASKPDVLVVMMHWFMLSSFMRDLPCRKVFLCRQVDERFFSMSIEGKTLAFRPEDYDLALAIEPFPTGQPLRRISPIVLRNRDEILPRKEALEKLGLGPGGKHCLLTVSGKPGEFEDVKRMYSYLGEEGYEMVYSSNYRGGLFPAVDYFNAFDMVICGAGYNAFWEAVYFQKEAIFVPQQRRFENQAWRVAECRDYPFERNGADQLVELIMGL